MHWWQWVGRCWQRADSGVLLLSHQLPLGLEELRVCTAGCGRMLGAGLAGP